MSRQMQEQQDSSNQALSPSDLWVWQHPTIVNIIQVLEVFSLDPGVGKLAASLTLTFDQLARRFRKDKSRSQHYEVRLETALTIRDSAFHWLKDQIESAAYSPDPSRATHQIEKALNCALALFCAQCLRTKLPRHTRQKASAYLQYMADQRWPRDDLLQWRIFQKP